MNAWTPGPWTDFFLSVVQEDGDKAICEVEDEFDTHNAGEAHANARLIAAAPELYDACLAAEQFIALDCGVNENDDNGEVLKQLRAALAKAGTPLAP